MGEAECVMDSTAATFEQVEQVEKTTKTVWKHGRCSEWAGDRIPGALGAVGFESDQGNSQGPLFMSCWHGPVCRD